MKDESILNSMTLLAAGQEVSLITLGNLAGVLLEVCMEIDREDLAVKLRDHLAMQEALREGWCEVSCPAADFGSDCNCRCDGDFHGEIWTW